MPFTAPQSSITNKFDAENIARADALRKQSDFEYGWQGEQARQSELAANSARAAAVYQQAVDGHLQTLQNIMEARASHENDKEKWELEKKQKALDLEKAQLSNNMTSTQIEMIQSIMNQGNKQKDAIFDAKDTLLDDAQHRTQASADQAKQGLAESLKVLMTQGMSAPTANIYNQSAPNIPDNLEVKRSITLPTSNGAEVIGAPKSYEDKMQQMRLAGLDPEVLLKGTGLYVPKEPKNANGDNSSQLSTLASSMPQLDSEATEEEKMAWLQQLPAGTASIVQKVASYQLPIQQITSLRGNQRLALAQLVSLYDPDIDLNKYAQRQKWLGSLASGDGNKQLLRINTAMGHIATLKNAFTELHNSNFTPWNKGVNAIKSGFGEPAPKRVELAGNAVADELETIFRMQGGSVEGIKAWRRSFDDASSPAQQAGVLNEALELLSSRVDALRQQNQNIMGKDDLQVLFPKSMEALKSLDGAKIGPATSNAGRVRVKSKDGQLFTVPAEQLEEALSQGYTRE